jgi:hypothetical protein
MKEIEVTAGEDIGRNDEVVIILGKAYLSDLSRQSIVTCNCGKWANHRLGDTREFACRKVLTHVDGWEKHHSLSFDRPVPADG